jgi:hypothetical protein
VAAEPRRHQLELRQPTIQIQSEGDGWQPRDPQGVSHSWPHSSGHSSSLADNTTVQVTDSEVTEDTPTLTRGTLTPVSPTETIPDVAAGVSEGFDLNRNRQQSNYLRVRQEGANVPSPNCYLSDTDSDASMANDEGNDNFSEQFFDVDCENHNGPRSLKTASGILLSMFVTHTLD